MSKKYVTEPERTRLFRIRAEYNETSWGWVDLNVRADSEEDAKARVLNHDFDEWVDSEITDSDNFEIGKIHLVEDLGEEEP